MKIPKKLGTAKKTGLVALLGLALAVSTVGGVALAAGADDWYDGHNSSVADHDNTGVDLKLYNAAGAAITSGSTTTPIAAATTRPTTRSTVQPCGRRTRCSNGCAPVDIRPPPPSVA